MLERELKRLSDNLRVPVSNLVRAILEDALSMADAATESVEDRLRRAARHLERERDKLNDKLKRRSDPDPSSDIVAFQEVTMAVPTTCALCKGDLARGSRASIGIRNGPDGPSKQGRSFVCTRCAGLG